jgi:hypothetical protein
MNPAVRSAGFLGTTVAPAERCLQLDMPKVFANSYLKNVKKRLISALPMH